MTFDANGGSNAPAVVVDDPGATVSVAETSPQRSGFGFDGWNTDAGGTGTAYASGDDYTLPANDGDVATLFAQWDPVDYSTIAVNATVSNPVFALDTVIHPGERFILSGEYLTALTAEFASTSHLEYVVIGVPSAGFDETSCTDGECNGALVTPEDFLVAFKLHRSNGTEWSVSQYYNNYRYEATQYVDATAVTDDIAFELSDSGDLIRLFGPGMETTLTEDVPSGLSRNVGDADTTPRSIYIAAVRMNGTPPAASEGAYKIAIPTPTPDMLTYAGNIDSLVADDDSDIGHIAVNTSGDVFSVTRAGDAWVSKHDASGVEQWRVATPISGDAFLAAASDGGLYVGGLDPVGGNAGVVKLDGDGNIEWSQFTATSSASGVGAVEIEGLDVLEGTSDSGVVFVGKVTGGDSVTLTYGNLSAAIPSGHAEYVAHVGADGTPVMIDATARGTISNFRGYFSVDARPNGSGAWWVVVGGTKPPTGDGAPSCARFTYDPDATPQLTEDFECNNNAYSADVALLSDGTVVAATAWDTTAVKLRLFDTNEVWVATITDDTYRPFPANGRGLEVDSSDNIYYAARRVGTNISIGDSSSTQIDISIPDSDPNGLLVKFNSDGVYQWSRTVGSGASTKASTVAVSGTTVYLGTSAKAMMQFDAYREKYTWKPAVFKFNSSGVSHN